MLVEILDGAHKLLEAGWCKVFFAEDINGGTAHHEDSTATRFCLLGAVKRSMFDLGLFKGEPKKLREAKLEETYIDVMDIFRELTQPKTPWAWNDSFGRTQKEVCDLVLEAKRIAQTRK